MKGPQKTGSKAAKPVPAGGEIVMSVPMLRQQEGSPPDLVLIWNEMPAPPAAIDIVLHLHGYAETGMAMNIATEKLRLSGLDFGDPDRPPGVTPARNRPTLCILPRGRFFGGRSERGYDFPALSDKGSVSELLAFALARFAATAGVRTPSVARRILTAHSGGGAAMMPVAAGFAPHEIHVFDALYSESPALAAWAVRAIAADIAALRKAPHASVAQYMARSGKALRVFYIPDSGTEPASQTIAVSIDSELKAAGPHGAALAPWYRVEPVRIDHFVIPRMLGWRLLTDAASSVA